MEKREKIVKMILPSSLGGGGGRHLLLLLALLDVLSAKVGIGHGHDHQGKKMTLFFLFLEVKFHKNSFIFSAFIQSESDLRYLVDDGIDVPFAEVSF